MSEGLRIEPVRPGDALVIEGFSAGGWVVAGRLFPQTLLVTAAAAWSLPPFDPADPPAGLLAPLAGLAAPPRLLLVGTGERMLRPPAAFVAAARAQGLVPESMDSGAAARTYNVLVGEGRQVAALLPPRQQP